VISESHFGWQSVLRGSDYTDFVQQMLSRRIISLLDHRQAIRIAPKVDRHCEPRGSREEIELRRSNCEL
jgi:hypothetical protein